MNCGGEFDRLEGVTLEADCTSCGCPNGDFVLVPKAPFMNGRADFGRWEDPNARKRQFDNNTQLAKRIEAGEPITPLTKDVPREFKADLDRKLCKRSPIGSGG